MFFAGQVTTAQLQLTTPLDCCCNCGAKRQIELVETPLQRTRYFLFFGTELELTETFPYCSGCRSSAKRVALSWPSKVLVACMLVAAAFLCVILLASHLPPIVQRNLFSSSVVLGVGLAFLHFGVRAKASAARSYYQPVSLVAAELDDERLRFLHLRFTNARYARLFSQANAELIAARVLQVAAPTSAT